MVKSSAPVLTPLMVSVSVSKPPACTLPAMPALLISCAIAAVLPASTAYRPLAFCAP